MIKNLSALVLSLSILLLASPAAQAQEADTQDFQTWTAVLGTAEVPAENLNLKLWFDGHMRRGGPGTTLILRPGLGYELTPWLSVWAGYAWVPVYSDPSGSRVDEHRAWQQIIVKKSWIDGRLNAQSRTRFEQRFHESSEATGLRVRQFARVDFRNHPNTPWGVALWDELFWGLNDPGFAASGFDQNRLFLGPTLQAREGLRIEAGYLWGRLERQETLLDQHVAAVNFFVAF